MHEQRRADQQRGAQRGEDGDGDRAALAVGEIQLGRDQRGDGQAAHAAQHHQRRRGPRQPRRPQLQRRQHEAGHQRVGHRRERAQPEERARHQRAEDDAGDEDRREEQQDGAQRARPVGPPAAEGHPGHERDQQVEGDLDPQRPGLPHRRRPRAVVDQAAEQEPADHAARRHAVGAAHEDHHREHRPVGGQHAQRAVAQVAPDVGRLASLQIGVDEPAPDQVGREHEEDVQGHLRAAVQPAERGREVEVPGLVGEVEADVEDDHHDRRQPAQRVARREPARPGRRLVGDTHASYFRRVTAPRALAGSFAAVLLYATFASGAQDPGPQTWTLLALTAVATVAGAAALYGNGAGAAHRPARDRRRRRARRLRGVGGDRHHQQRHARPLVGGREPRRRLRAGRGDRDGDRDLAAAGGDAGRRRARRGVRARRAVGAARQDAAGRQGHRRAAQPPAGAARLLERARAVLRQRAAAAAAPRRPRLAARARRDLRARAHPRPDLLARGAVRARRRPRRPAVADAGALAHAGARAVGRRRHRRADRRRRRPLGPVDELRPRRPAHGRRAGPAGGDRGRRRAAGRCGDGRCANSACPRSRGAPGRAPPRSSPPSRSPSSPREASRAPGTTSPTWSGWPRRRAPTGCCR